MLFRSLSAGFSPGPLFALVISETVQHGTGAGIRIAIAPVITDIPIVLISWLLVLAVSEAQIAIGIISLAGSAFLLFTGIGGIRTRSVELPENSGTSPSLLKGVLVNFLSPHPYMFWITVGAPTMVKAIKNGYPSAVVFLAAFYLSIVGSKIVIAMVTGRSRKFFSGKTYVYLLRALGLLLCLYGLLLLKEGALMLGFFHAAALNIHRLLACAVL